MDASLVLSQILKVALLAGIAFGCGLLVQRFGVKVNYTRKINHFALFSLPLALDDYFGVARGIMPGIVNGFATVAMFGVFWEPVRSRLTWAQVMFLSYDRPEDRPHTLHWLVTQFLAALVVIIAMLLYFHQAGYAHLALMVILIATIGDGLAEPIGVRFGRRTYSVRGFLSDRTYSRSYIGSLCVYLTSIAGILLFYDSFTPTQICAALALIPLAMTFAEAVSPHTWDTPFLIFSGAGCVVLIKQFLP
jgi:phytol kinase